MTAPNYPDKDVVLGVTKKTLLNLITGEATIESSLAQIALDLWKARDKARETAALQDEGIHWMQARLWFLEKLEIVVREDRQRRDLDYCDCPVRIGHPSFDDHTPQCKKIRKALEALDKFKAGK